MSDAATPALAQLLRRHWDPSAPVPCIRPVDWTPLVRQALHHGAGGLLCRALQTLPDELVPIEIREAAGVYLEHADAEGRRRVAETIEVLDVLETDGIPALAFKGVALAVLAHRDPLLRPGKDIDVLVRREDMRRSVQSLAKLGYRLAESLSARIEESCFDTYGQDTLFAKGRLPVEPHWTFTPRTLCVDFDLDALWRNAIAIDMGGRTTRTLSIEDTVLVACLHGAKEKWWRLLWVADLAALVHRHPQLDWNAVVDRASRAGILRIVHIGLGLARELFSLPLPAHLLSAIDQDAKCRALIEESRQRVLAENDGPEPPMRVSRFHWHARERLRDRLRYVIRTVTTPQFVHYRMVALPDPLVFGYVPLKLVHDYLLLPLWRTGKRKLWARSRANLTTQ